MAYDNQCGSCREYEFKGDNRKGYCSWYKTYYYPDDSCSHQRPVGYVSSNCYLTTVVCDILNNDDSCDVLNALRNLRDNVLQKDKKYEDVLFEYDTVGPVIAHNLAHDYHETHDKTMFNQLYNVYIKKTAKLYKEGNIDNAVNKYRQMTESLKEYYNIDMKLPDKNNYDMTLGGHGKVILKK